MERKLIKTHFIETSDNIDSIVSKYILPVLKDKDIVIFSEKIVSIIQRRVIYKKDLRVGFWAKFLSKFARKTPHGFSVGNPLKMQVAINLAGLPRILLASFLGGLLKMVGIRGVFYIVAGNQISQIDGFYGEAFSQYSDMGILGSKDSQKLCNDLKNKYSFSCAVVDINDLGGIILGTSDDIKEKRKMILNELKDNPGGQGNQQTPIIILRNV